jgi:hypothetical protein
LDVKDLEGDDGTEIMSPHYLVCSFLQSGLHLQGAILDDDGYVQVGIRTGLPPDPGAIGDEDYSRSPATSFRLTFNSWTIFWSVWLNIIVASFGSAPGRVPK